MQTHFQEALASPRMVYSSPESVLADATLSQNEKRQILKSWEAEAIHLQDSESEGFGGGERSRLDAVERALQAIR